MALVSFRALTAITAGQPVTVGSSGTIFPSSAANLNNAKCIGIALDSASEQGLVRVDKDSIQYIFSGQTTGNIPYLSIISGTIQASYTDFQTELNSSALSSAYLVPLGRAVSSSGINIEIGRPVFVTTPL
jgi:hypothetical protein